MIEPWISGSHQDVSPLLRPLLHAFDHARLDLAQWTEGLTTEEIWSTPHGLGSIGFHLRHIAGSADRLFTYVQGAQLSDAQMAALRSEKETGATRDQLLSEIEQVFSRIAKSVLAIEEKTLPEPRGVGRKQLPTTVHGLLVHMGEHTMRHVGEIIVTVRIVKALR